MRLYQFFTTASQANACNIQIVARGKICAVTWNATIDSVADNSVCRAELSFQAASQIDTHNAQGIISAMAQWQNGAAVVAAAGVNYFDACLAIPVEAGDVIYLNTSLTAGTVKAILHVE